MVVALHSVLVVVERERAADPVSVVLSFKKEVGVRVGEDAGERRIVSSWSSCESSSEGRFDVVREWSSRSGVSVRHSEHGDRGRSSC